MTVVVRCIGQQAVQYQVGQAGACFIVETLPVISRTEHVAGGDAGQQLAWGIPSHHLVLGVNHECGQAQRINYAFGYFHGNPIEWV